MNKEERLTRRLLKRFLDGETHMGFDEAVADFPLEFININPPNVPYTPWQLLEHLRFTQFDILDFMRNPNYKEPSWPDDYWPGEGKKADRKIWQATIKSFKKDLNELQKIAADPKTDLYFVIPWGDDQTILEELIKVSDHNSYHLGEFAILRQVMYTWPQNRKQ